MFDGRRSGIIELSGKEPDVQEEDLEMKINPKVIVPEREWEYRGVKISFRKERSRNHFSFRFDTIATQQDLAVTICPPTITEIDGIKWVKNYHRCHQGIYSACSKIDALIEFNNQQLINNQ